MYAAQTEYDREMERAFWLSKQKAEAIENLKQRDVMLSFTSKIEMGKDDEPPPLEPAAREPTARSRSRSPPTGIDSICALTNPTDGPYEPLAPHMQQVNDERRAKFTKKAAAACIDARQRDLKGNLDAKLWDKNGNRNWYGMNKEYQIILGMPKRFAGAAAIGRLRRDTEDSMFVDLMLNTRVVDSADFQRELRAQLEAIKPPNDDDDDDDDDDY